MIEQEAVHRAVVAAGETRAKAIAVEPAQARLAAKDAAHEGHGAPFAEQVHHFVVETFVEVVPVRVLQATDRVDVFERARAMLELLDPLRELGEGLFDYRHGGRSPKNRWQMIRARV